MLLKSNNLGLYRNCRFSMYKFVTEENNKVDNAFSLLAEVIRYDLSGVLEDFDKQFIDIYVDSFFPYKSSLIKMAPGITNFVVDYQKENDLTDVELRNKLINEMSKFKLSFSIFSVEECADIVIFEINNDVKSLVKIYDNAKIRFNDKYGIK